MNLSRCAACSHTFQTDLQVTIAYNAAYAHQYDLRPAAEMSRIRWEFIQDHLQLPAGSRVLDIGYGNGAFLKHARSAGMDIYGIDVHTEDFGIPTLSMDTTMTFDVITFFDSLEHFPSFEPVLRLQSRHIVVSIPNTPRFILTRPTTWRHYKPGEHLHYFSPDSLSEFMRRWGFPRLVATDYPEDALRGKLQIEGETLDNILTAVYSRA